MRLLKLIATQIRRTLSRLLRKAPNRTKRLEDFQFIGSGYSTVSDLEPISERLDEALAGNFDQ